MYAYLADSPERHSLCSLTRGNGNYTLRWGYLFDKRLLVDVLPACNKCLSVMKSGASICDIHCKKCLNWNIATADNDLMYFSLPEHYPTDLGDMRRRKISSKKVTFQGLKEACALTCYKIKKGEWNSKQANSYLSVNGINGTLREAIMNDADNTSHTTQANECHEDECDGMPVEAEKHVLPPIWDIPEGISSMPDVPMHLLFLNVTKNSVNLILDWCSFINNDRQKTLHSLGDIFEGIYELKLEWMKILPLRTALFGGWVSENWLAFGRILRWAFSTINDMESSLQLEEQMKTREQKKWTKMMNKYWLQSRSLDTDGLAVELRERVATFMKDDNCPQKVITKPGGTPEDIMNMITSLSRVLAYSMDPLVDDQKIDNVDKSVRIFLSYLEIVDKCMRNGKRNPVWSTSYSYICLLNIPDVLKNTVIYETYGREDLQVKE